MICVREFSDTRGDVIRPVFPIFERRLPDYEYHAQGKERAHLPAISSEGVLG